MSKDNLVSADQLVHVKREFWFPNNFLVNLVPKYPEYFRPVGCPGDGKSFSELVSWNPEFEKSVIDKRAEEGEKMMGIRVRLLFYVKLPRGKATDLNIDDTDREMDSGIGNVSGNSVANGFHGGGETGQDFRVLMVVVCNGGGNGSGGAVGSDNSNVAVVACVGGIGCCSATLFAFSGDSAGKGIDGAREIG
ncbi:hypothetical protein RJ639_014218 [Escallonia herrerae]|uniref:PORR domain-containing protein n=1 Tax=Escallonia herrerae TaxID=1293975 RepID=A0AA88VIE4_9ASTE|nr:hypothetical protein RJ639_014218 [Escallonia herrerae]